MVDSVCEWWLEGLILRSRLCGCPLWEAAPYPRMCGLWVWMFRSRSARGWIIAESLLLEEATHTDKMAFAGGNGPA